MIIENVIKVEDSGFTYYLGSILPQQIMQLTFVPCEVQVEALRGVLNVRPTDGYQREGDVMRMRKIKTHFGESERSIIPPVLLSTRGKWLFRPKTQNSCFGSIEAEDCAAIIDGQHRLGGLSMLSSDPETERGRADRKVPFMAVQFNDAREEQEQFEIINDEQKGIPKSHLKFINRHAQFPGIAADVLKEDTDSVFVGRIAVAKRGDADLITFGAAEEIVSLMFDSQFTTSTGFFPGRDQTTKSQGIRLILEYWKCVRECFPVQWSDMEKMPPSRSARSTSHPGRSKFTYRLLEETGIRALAKVGATVLAESFECYQSE
jgi:DNA sulfur modification protein DndB